MSADDASLTETSSKLLLHVLHHLLRAVSVCNDASIDFLARIRILQPEWSLHGDSERDARTKTWRRADLDRIVELP